MALLAFFHNGIWRRVRELGSVAGVSTCLALCPTWFGYFGRVFAFTPFQLVGSKLLISHSWASFPPLSLSVHTLRAFFALALQAGKCSASV